MDNYSKYDYFNNGYGMGSYGNAPMTNVIKVTSLDEAIVQTNRRPSDMVYFNQDKDEFYNVKVDYDGRKSWATFTYTVPNPDANAPASKAEVSALAERISAMESKLGGVLNAESDG